MATTEPNGLFHYRRMAAYRMAASAGKPVPYWIFQDWHAYMAEVAKRVDGMGRQLYTCAKCRMPIQYFRSNGDVYWVVTESSTTADGLSYCPPNPDARRHGSHRPTTLGKRRS